MAELVDGEDWYKRYRNGRYFIDNEQPELAILELRLALELAPQESELHAALLQSLLLSGQRSEAQEHLRTQFSTVVPSSELYYWAGMVEQDAGDLKTAKRQYQLALKMSSQFAPAHLQMARLYRHEKSTRQALIAYRKYMQLKPQDWDAALELADLLSEFKDYETANKLYREVYIHCPHRTDVLLKWLQNQAVHNPSQIVKLLINLALQYPHLKSTLALHAASILKASGEIEEARKSYELALQDPALPETKAYALFKDTLFCPIAPSNQAIQDYAQKLEQALTQALQQEHGPEESPLVSPDYTNLMPYLRLWEGPGFLPYYNIDPKICREKFARFFQSVLPQVNAPSPAQPNSPPHLAIVLNSNTAIQAFFMGILYHWPQTQLQVTLLYTQPANFLPQLRQLRPDFRHLELSEEPAEALQTLRDVKADLIFYTEIHTDRLLQSFLAAHRLAPVQVTSWLSSGTSGYTTVDYFISSRLLEQNSQPERFYTERLILLEHLPASLATPLYPGQKPQRSEYGLPEQGRIYLCPHPMIKLHPDFDHVLAEILERDSEAQLVLLARPSIPNLQQLLLQRFEKSFPHLMSRIWFMPKMEHQDFLGLLQQADVMLDPFYFGGGTTSYEALGLGVPVVTWPGARLHGRITYAYYQMMQIFDCVAYSPEDYVERCLQIAQNPIKNQALRQKLLAASQVLFHRKEAVQSLSECLIRLTGSATG